METGNCKTWCQALLIHFMRWYWNALILNKFTGSSEFGGKIKCSRVHIARDGSKKRWCLCVLLIVQTKGELEDAHIARDPRQRGFPGPLSHKWLYPLERSYRIKTIFNNRGLFARLLVDQSTNWLTNCSFGLLIFVNQMSILVDELINQMTKK